MKPVAPQQTTTTMTKEKMTLTAEELQWIANRMDWYSIKFQEIYDELADHIITAIEAARAAGDNRNIENVFQTVVDDHFGGYLGIDNVAASYEHAYRKRIAKTMRANYRYYLNWQTITLLVVLIISAFYFPISKPTFIVIMCGLFITAVAPVVYAYTRSTRIKTTKGKKSMVKNYVLGSSNLSIFMLMTTVNLVNIAREQWHIDVRGSVYTQLCFMLLLFPFVIYGLSVIRLCKQEFKIVD